MPFSHFFCTLLQIDQTAPFTLHCLDNGTNRIRLLYEFFYLQIAEKNGKPSKRREGLKKFKIGFLPINRQLKRAINQLNKS